MIQRLAIKLGRPPSLVGSALALGCAGAVVLGVLLGMAAFGGAGRSSADRTASTSSSLGSAVGGAASDGPHIVVAKSELVVRRAPDAASPVVTQLAPETRLGSTTVLFKVGQRPGWVEVQLPIRPNGSTGWVAASAVTEKAVSGEIVVDLATRKMRIQLGGRTVADTTVGIGSPQNPTPTGKFYVTDRVRPSRPGGPYGAFALGLSAHSETLTEFGGGDGQVGIHGTNDPSSIGRNVTHGCVRVPAAVAEILANVPLGTPVVIR